MTGSINIAELCSPTIQLIINRYTDQNNGNTNNTDSNTSNNDTNNSNTTATTIDNITESIQSLSLSIDSIIPIEFTTTPFSISIYQYLSLYNWSIDNNSIEFNPILTSEQRKIIHSICLHLNLQSISYNLSKSLRYIIIYHPIYYSKSDKFLLHNGNLYYHSPTIDSNNNNSNTAIIQDNQYIIPIEYINNRIARDGPYSHITILHKNTIQLLYNYYTNNNNNNNILIVHTDTISNVQQ